MGVQGILPPLRSEASRDDNDSIGNVMRETSQERQPGVWYSPRPPEMWFCPLAGILSALLHASAIIALLYLLSPRTVDDNHGYLQLDVCSVEGLSWLPGRGMDGSRTNPAGKSSNAGEVEAVTSNANNNPDNANEPLVKAVFIQTQKSGHQQAAVQTSSPVNLHSATTSGEAGTTSQGMGSLSQTGTTSFFNIRANCRKVIYVIDRSSSMGQHGAWRLAVHELLSSLRTLPTDTQFQVIIYNSNARMLIPSRQDWMSVNQKNVDDVELALSEVYPEGSTQHNMALPTALSMGPDVIFFLSDGDNLESQYLRKITQDNGGRTVIHTIVISDGHVDAQDTMLAEFSRVNGGEHRAIKLH